MSEHSNSEDLPSINDSEETNDPEIDAVVNDYIVKRLPIRSNGFYYRPYDIAVFLSRFIPFSIFDTKISKYRIITLLMHFNYVPFKRTAINKLIQRFKLDGLPNTITWTQLSKSGRKPFLSKTNLLNLIEKIKQDSDGGLAFSSSDVQDCVRKEIIIEWTQKKKLHLLPFPIPDNTIYYYTSLIKSQALFNVFDSIANKTEARSIAEWSFRSTISFLMTVSVSHFLYGVQPTVFHPKKKDLSNESVLLWNLVEKYHGKMLGISSNDCKMLPVLPNLITSTDEITIFATSSIVNGKESFYIVAKPSVETNTKPSSSSRNNYKKTITGDQHCRGIRIVINSTFTAGGLSSPIFVTIYGMTSEEMPSNEIITIPVPGLTVGSHQDIFSSGIGYVTFVRGGDENQRSQSNSENEDVEMQEFTTIPNSCESKESRIAQLYREKVYYPFIKHIRVSKYCMDKDTETIPDSLTAISWMDGANGQIRKITSIQSLMKDEKLKIKTCKHSASRTAVEQAADCGPMFKLMKRIVREMEIPHAAYNNIYQYLEDKINSLSKSSPSSNNDTLLLTAHKKKAILATIPKLPIATGQSFTIENVKKGFILNGQLDSDSKLVPSLTNIIHTYRGDITGTCLEDHEKLFENFYEEAFVNGMVNEILYDLSNIPVDKNHKGEPVLRNMNISLENRQRAKVLSSPVQIEARQLIVDDKKRQHYLRQKAVFDKEQQLYEMNDQCERKLVRLIVEKDTSERVKNETSNDTLHRNIETIPYSTVMDKIQPSMLESRTESKILNKDMVSFIKVRSVCMIRGLTQTYKDIPTRRDKLIARLIELRQVEVKPRHFPLPPTIPDDVDVYPTADDEGLEDEETSSFNDMDVDGEAME